jgi:F0F1-type ATP synthase membrane subunit b/b'
MKLPYRALAAAAWFVPSLALAAGDAHGGHGGQLHFVDVVAGAESVHFWGSFINWFLLVVLLGYFAAKPVREMLGARRREMEVAIREASAAKAAADARHAEYTARLAQLDQELARLRADIQRAAEQHAEALERQVRREVVDAAVTTAERVLRESIQSDDQRRLADSYREQVARERAVRGQA